MKVDTHYYRECTDSWISIPEEGEGPGVGFKRTNSKTTWWDAQKEYDHASALKRALAEAERAKKELEEDEYQC